MISPAHHTELAALAQRIEQENACPVLSAQATQLVMGRGAYRVPLVIIGEAPGRQEDETGQPFMGAAGKLLDSLLADNGLDRDDPYITNIVKYRPLDNRDPSREEKAAFLPYLKEELALLQPKLVLTLGRHAMSYFLPDATIGEAHGQPQQWSEGGLSFTLLPLYHPSATIYNKQVRQALHDEFTQVPTLLSSL